MPRRVVIIQGHPTRGGGHFCHALEAAYARGAAAAGHAVERVAVAELDFPLLASKADWEAGAPPADIQKSQAMIGAADHLLIIYPLWLGTLPAILKGFFEQVFRPGFALAGNGQGFGRKLLTGKSARIVVTMGMPALVYRWYFGAHGLKSLERNVLRFCGIGPIRDSLIGMVEGSARRRQKWLERMERLGRGAR